MRITKKYAGVSSLGKRVFHASSFSHPQEEIDKTQKELDFMERKFKEKMISSREEHYQLESMLRLEHAEQDTKTHQAFIPMPHVAIWPQHMHPMSGNQSMYYPLSFGQQGYVPPLQVDIPDNTTHPHNTEVHEISPTPQSGLEPVPRDESAIKAHGSADVTLYSSEGDQFVAGSTAALGSIDAAAGYFAAMNANSIKFGDCMGESESWCLPMPMPMPMLDNYPPNKRVGVDNSAHMSYEGSDTFHGYPNPGFPNLSPSHYSPIMPAAHVSHQPENQHMSYAVNVGYPMTMAGNPSAGASVTTTAATAAVAGMRTDIAPPPMALVSYYYHLQMFQYEEALRNYHSANLHDGDVLFNGKTTNESTAGLPLPWFPNHMISGVNTMGMGDFTDNLECVPSKKRKKMKSGTPTPGKPFLTKNCHQEDTVTLVTQSAGDGSNKGIATSEDNSIIEVQSNAISGSSQDLLVGCKHDQQGSVVVPTGGLEASNY